MRLWPALLLCASCAATSVATSNTTAPPALLKPPTEDSGLLGDGFSLRLPPDWAATLSSEETPQGTRQQLIATWGEPVRAWLRLQTRDQFLSGEDLVQRDLPAWLQSLGAPLEGEPVILEIKGKNKGLRVAVQISDAIGTWYVERAYLYGADQSRSYVLTFRTAATQAASFTEQLLVIFAGLTIQELALSPRDASACREALVALRDSGRVAKEIDCLQEIGTPETESTAWWLLLGNAYDRADLALLAIEAYRSAARESTSDDGKLQALLAEGRVYRSQEKFPEAVAAYKQAIKLSPNSLAATLGLGLSLHVGGAPREAISLYRAWLEREPTLQIQENLALALEDTGEFREAVSCWDKALTLRRSLEKNAENQLWIEKGEKALLRLREKAERRGTFLK